MRDAIVGLGMGGPDSESAIEPFLVNLLSDRDIINFGIGSFLQNLLARRIAKKRSKAVAPFYAKMKCNGGSPQLMHTTKLLNKLKGIYEERVGVCVDVYAGMCYWHPFIPDVVDGLIGKGYRNIYIFPLYPQYSCTTTGVCYRRLDRALKGLYLDETKPHTAEAKLSQIVPNIVKIQHFYDNEHYLQLVVEDIISTAKQFNGEVHLLISAHSLPQSVIDSGDVYQSQIEDEAELIMGKLRKRGSNISSYSIGYQSKLGRQKWLTPNIVNELERVVKVEGKKQIVLYAISFINDHIETLIELDEELQEIAKKLGVAMMRVPTLNDDDRFAKILVDILITADGEVSKK